MRAGKEQARSRCVTPVYFFQGRPLPMRSATARDYASDSLTPGGESHPIDRLGPGRVRVRLAADLTCNKRARIRRAPARASPVCTQMRGYAGVPDVHRTVWVGLLRMAARWVFKQVRAILVAGDYRALPLFTCGCLCTSSAAQFSIDAAHVACYYSITFGGVALSQAAMPSRGPYRLRRSAPASV